VREYDVLIAHILGVVKASSIVQKTALSLLISRYSLQRQRSLEELVCTLLSIEQDGVLLDFRESVAAHCAKKDGPEAAIGPLMLHAVPDYLADFISASRQVVNHPRRAAALHVFRIKGKPLRYLMEVSQNCFGSVFPKSYKRVKAVIELLGDIHDIDVALATLSAYLAEIRMANAPAFPQSSIRIQTGFLRTAIASLRQKRSGYFITLSSTVETWRREDFDKKLIAAMSGQPAEQIARSRL
jgi:CHAD domain-containing protein